MTTSPALDDYLLELLDSAPSGDVDPAPAAMDPPVAVPSQAAEPAAAAEVAAILAETDIVVATLAEASLTQAAVAERTPSAAPAAAEARQAVPVLPAKPAPPRPVPAFNTAPRYVAPPPLPLDRRQQHGHEERRRASERTTRWLRMRCDDQHYALELLKVQEVVLPGTLLPLRGGPRHLLGVMNLLGQVVPVLDLGLYLGRAAIVSDSATRIAVLEENGEVLGLRVSAVEDVTNLTDQQIEPPDNSGMCRITDLLFRGVARQGGRTVILLDASQLLT
jgi:purine-binding chemotaxis protein CheW